MAKGIPLTPGQVKDIESAVDELFDRVQTRVLGPQLLPKRIAFTYIPELTLQGLFAASSSEEGNVPDEELVKPFLKVAQSYLDAYRARAKAQVVREVGSFLADAANKGVDTNVRKVLGGKLADVWKEATNQVKAMVDTEATHVRNLGTLDSITKINAASGIDDPIVYFVVVRDRHLCDECRRLHLLPDGRPRLWRLSELGSGYHKRGEKSPKLGGLHPHCRCSLVTLMPGYGFDQAGMVTYIGPGHDEFKNQRGE